jgi:hypothetical protein
MQPSTPGDIYCRPITGYPVRHYFMTIDRKWTCVHYCKKALRVCIANLAEVIGSESQMWKVWYPGAKSFSQRETVERMLESVNKESYNLINDSCQDICLEAKYGDYGHLVTEVGRVARAGSVVGLVTAALVSSPLLLVPSALVAGYFCNVGSSRIYPRLEEIPLERIDRQLAVKNVLQPAVKKWLRKNKIGYTQGDFEFIVSQVLHYKVDHIRNNFNLVMSTVVGRIIKKPHTRKSGRSMPQY